MKLAGVEVGANRPLFLIAGPCVVETETLAVETAEGLPVQAVGGDVGFDFFNIATDLGFEPALRLVQVNGVCSVFCPGVTEAEDLFD